MSKFEAYLDVIKASTDDPLIIAAVNATEAAYIVPLGIKQTRLHGRKIISLTEEESRALIVSALKDHRKAAGLTQFEVEDKIGVPRRTIEKWERGGSIPSHYVLWLVLKALREVRDEN